MSTKVKFLLVIISLTVTLSLMSNTYSRYVASNTGDLKVQFASWQILVNNDDITSSDTSEIVLTPVIENNDNVESGKFAPTSTGYFDIEINPENTELSFDYLIEITPDNENLPDLRITKYTIIDSDNNNQDDQVFEMTDIIDNTLSGTLLYDNDDENFSFKSFTLRVYFEWYDGVDELMDDDADTEAAGIEFNITANIKFEQHI